MEDTIRASNAQLEAVLEASCIIERGHAYGLIATQPPTLSPMARKPRVDAFDGFYHVLARGNRHATIFHDDAGSHAYMEPPLIALFAFGGIYAASVFGMSEGEIVTRCSDFMP